MIQRDLIQAGGHFARTNRFLVSLTYGSSAPGVGGSAPSSIDILCKNITIPEVNTEPKEMVFKGHKVLIPSRVNQSQTVTMTFYMDQNYDIRSSMYKWMTSLDDHYYDGHGDKENSPKYGAAKVTALDYTESQRPISWTFEGLFPISVGEVAFDGADKDSIQELTVSFAFFRYKEI